MSKLANRNFKVSSNKYAFGLDQGELSAKLQQLADDVQSGRILPQEVSHATKNVPDEFELITLTVTYAEPREVGK